jgi:hypothetical protein
VGAAIACDLFKRTAGTLSAPARRKLMAYTIAGIDVHKKMLAVVASDVEVEHAPATRRAQE